VFIRAFRHTLYDGAAPSGGTLAYLAVVSLASLMFGWFVFQKLNRRLAEEI